LAISSKKQFTGKSAKTALFLKTVL